MCIRDRGEAELLGGEPGPPQADGPGGPDRRLGHLLVQRPPLELGGGELGGQLHLRSVGIMPGQPGRQGGGLLPRPRGNHLAVRGTGWGNGALLRLRLELRPVHKADIPGPVSYTHLPSSILMS